MSILARISNVSWGEENKEADIHAAAAAPRQMKIANNLRSSAFICVLFSGRRHERLHADKDENDRARCDALETGFELTSCQASVRT